MTGIDLTSKAMKLNVKSIGKVEAEEEECSPETCDKKACQKSGKCMMESEDD